MKCTLATDRFMVYDDVLAEEPFKELVRYVADQSFKSVHEEGWQKVWSLADGVPLKGKHAVFSNPLSGLASHNGTDKEAAKEHPFSLYPTGDSIDELLAVIIGIKTEIVPLVGVQGQEWERFSAVTYLYPPGTGLSWHNDAGIYTGAFTFYLTEHWQSNWGGELMTYCGTTGELTSGLAAAAQLREYTDHHIPFSRSSVGDGIGFYIEPRPNRLVILKGGTPHKVNHIVQAAGARARATVAGFFVKPMRRSTSQGAEISLKTTIEKRDVPYVARLHGGKSSLIARGHTYATGTEDLYEIFRFMADARQPFTPADLPGDLPVEEKLELVRDLAGIGMFR